jgi:hypothetical protein
MDYWDIFIKACIAAFSGGLIAGIFGLIKSLGGMKRSLDSLLQSNNSLVQSTQMIARLQRPQLVAHKAALEALRDGRCNGNVTDAHRGINDAFGEYDDFLVGKVGT